MGQYKLSIYRKAQVMCGVFYEREQCIEINILCFRIIIGLTDGAKGFHYE